MVCVGKLITASKYRGLMYVQCIVFPSFIVPKLSSDGFTELKLETKAGLAVIGGD